MRPAAMIVSLALILCAVSSGLAANETPNIVIIFTDDQGYGDVGCFGAQGWTTPNLDRMAEQGRKFTSFLRHAARLFRIADRPADRLLPEPSWNPRGARPQRDARDSRRGNHAGRNLQAEGATRRRSSGNGISETRHGSFPRITASMSIWEFPIPTICGPFIRSTSICRPMRPDANGVFPRCR